jgi:hypothetical protein
VPSQETTRPPQTIRWLSHPARREPVRALLALSIALLASVVAGLAASPAAGAAGLFFLLGSIASFLLPTRITLDATQVVVERGGLKRARSWSELRRWTCTEGRVLLSPFRGQHRLERVRGLMFELAEAPDSVEPFLRDRLGEAQAS